MTIAPIRQPSAVLPVVMSLAALTIVLIHLLRFGAAPQADEGASAHLWQLLMAGQVPIVGFYALTHLTQTPKTAVAVLTVQFLAGVAAAAPIFLLGW
jgi:hypothetical protein